MSKTKSLVITLLYFLATFASARESADFLIVPQPRDYTIYNQYQQPVTDVEKTRFAENIPAQIENSNELLGDQITHAVKFLFDGKPWFLQKDESGNFSGSGRNLHPQTYRKCEIIDDTVAAAEDHAVSFSEKGPSARGSDFLRKGEVVVRVFSYGSSFYAKRGFANPVYGWCMASRTSAWKAIATAESAHNAFGSFSSDQIVKRFTEANKTYREYFEHFNAFTRQEKTVPAWLCVVQGNQVRCTLNMPYRETSQLDESTRCLVRDVENTLIGKGYEVITDKGEVIVRPRAESAGAR
jgi:hypothetical protein